MKPLIDPIGHVGPVNGGSQEMGEHGSERVWGSERLNVLAQLVESETVVVALLAQSQRFLVHHFELVAVLTDGVPVVFYSETRFADGSADEKRRAHLPADRARHLDSSVFFVAE